MAYIILEECFNELVDRKWDVIAKRFDISLVDVQQVFDYLQTLTPTPGAAFGSTDGLYIIPDLTVKVEEQTIIVISNRKSLPAIKFQQNYFEQMKQHADPEVLDYLKQKQQDFDWLKKTIEQRGDTIYNVGKAIVERQQEFFLEKEHPIKPLILKDIAEELAIHESTVSRAVNGKFLETDFGVFELKRFFSHKLSSEDGDDRSTSDVKQQLKLLIEQEDKKKPLSDQKLVELLKAEGIDISRRTVAKYRDALKIPSSSKRKRYD